MATTGLLVIFGFGFCSSGVIVPSPDATAGDVKEEVILESRSFLDPPRVPSSSNLHRNYDMLRNDNVDRNREEPGGQFINLAAPCRLLLEPFKTELLRDKSTFHVSFDPSSLNFNLIDLNLQQTTAQVSGLNSFTVVDCTPVVDGVLVMGLEFNEITIRVRRSSRSRRRRSSQYRMSGMYGNRDRDDDIDIDRSDRDRDSEEDGFGNRDKYSYIDKYNKRDDDHNKDTYNNGYVARDAFSSSERYNERDGYVDRDRYKDRDWVEDRNRSIDKDRYDVRDKYDDRDKYNDRDRYDDNHQYEDRGKYEDWDKYGDTDRNRGRYDDRDRYDERNAHRDRYENRDDERHGSTRDRAADTADDLMVQIYSLKLEYKYVSDKVTRAGDKDRQTMSRVRLQIEDAHFRFDDNSAKQMTQQSGTSDTGNYIRDKMARTVFDAVKRDLEIQIENILTRIILDLKDQARDHPDERYQGSSRYKREVDPPMSNPVIHNSRREKRFSKEHDQPMNISNGRGKPIRRDTGYKREQRITGRRSRRLQSKNQKNSQYRRKKPGSRKCSCKRGREDDDSELVENF